MAEMMAEVQLALVIWAEQCFPAASVHLELSVAGHLVDEPMTLRAKIRSALVHGKTETVRLVFRQQSK